MDKVTVNTDDENIEFIGQGVSFGLSPTGTLHIVNAEHQGQGVTAVFGPGKWNNAMKFSDTIVKEPTA